MKQKKVSHTFGSWRPKEFNSAVDQMVTCEGLEEELSQDSFWWPAILSVLVDKSLHSLPLSTQVLPLPDIMFYLSCTIITIIL